MEGTGGVLGRRRKRWGLRALGLSEAMYPWLGEGESAEELSSFTSPVWAEGSSVRARVLHGDCRKPVPCVDQLNTGLISSWPSCPLLPSLGWGSSGAARGFQGEGEEEMRSL